MDWILANWGNLLIGLIVLIGVYFALRNVIRTQKEGGCASCSADHSCHSHCCGQQKEEHSR